MNNTDTDKLLEEAFDKIKSKFSGAMHAAGKFLSTGNVGVANVGYTAQSVIKRNELFKKRVGDYLSKIEQFDATGATKLNTISHIGPIAIQSQSTVSEPSNGQQYTSSTGFTYTYNSKAKAWFDATGKKMGNSSMMTKKFLKKYPMGFIIETFLNEAGEVFAYEREIEKEIKSFITDLANQFNVTGNNTKEILAKLEKLPVVPDLKKSITELNTFIKELGTKTKLNIKVPEIKITAPAKKPTAPTSTPTPIPTPSTAKKTPSTTAKKGDIVMVGTYKFQYDGNNWINPVTKKPENRDLILTYINDELSKKSAASKKTVPKKASLKSPKDGAVDLSKKYKFDAGKKLWVNIASNVALTKSNSDKKTQAYWNAVAAKKIVPEGITKITYKEFFV
jgi:hypothetical protein